MDSTFMFSNGLLNLDVKNNYAGEFNKIKTDFNLKSYNAYAVGNKLDTIAVNLNVTNGKNTFKVVCNLDTSFVVHTNGWAGFNETKTRIVLDTLGFTYKNYNFGNKEPIKINYEIIDSIQDINFENFLMADKNQSLEIKGKYSLNGKSNLDVSARRIKSANLQLLSDPYIDEQDLIKGNIRRFVLNYNGTLEKPVIHIEANSDILSINETKLGRLDAIINYKDNILKPDFAFYNPNNKGKLLIYGDVPIQNPLKGTGEIDTNINILEEDVSLYVDADNFQIRLLEQLIPDITDLDGTMNGEVNVAGNVINPLLTGSIKLNNGAFTIDLTGVRYSFNADLISDKQKLILQRSKLYTPSEEN
jgi:autotransporter translocation and assembly factor TamB